MASVNSVDSSSNRNYLDWLDQDPDVKSGATSKTERVYNAVFEDNAEKSIGFKDLFSLMINQLSNQDFLNPVDDNQYLAQMTQIASMSAMQELAKYSQSQYMTSFLGREVTITKYEIGGEVKTETGIVEGINWTNDDYKFMVNGKPYTLKEISNVSLPKTTTDTKTDENKTSDSTEAALLELAKYTQSQYMNSFLGKEVTINFDTVYGVVSEVGTVEKVDWKDNKYQFIVNGKPYSLEEITNIALAKKEDKSEDADTETE